jgi:hypothetical protein
MGVGAKWMGINGVWSGLKGKQTDKAPIKFWIPWMLACQGMEPSVGGGGRASLSVGSDPDDVYKGSEPGAEGYGYVARMMAMSEMWGISRMRRGK